MLSTLGRETTGLVRMDVATGKVLEEIASSDKCNVGGILLDDDSKEVRLLRAHPPARGPLATHLLPEMRARAAG